MIHITLLNPSLDLIYEIPDSNRLTHLDLPARIFPAGKGLNVAKVIAILGEEVTLHSIMPEDDFDRFDKYCQHRGIIHKPISVRGAVRVNTTVYDKSIMQTTHYNSASEPLSTQIQDRFMGSIIPQIKKDEKWIFSGSLPKGIEPNFYAELIKECHKREATTFVDTRGLALQLALDQTPFLATPNEEELNSLFDDHGKGLNNLIKKSRSILETGVQELFVTLGSDGVLAFNKDEVLMCKAPDVKVLDTVGCGDSFLAGVAVAKERGFSFHEVCRLAVATGSSNASCIGPGEISRDQVWELMEKVEVVTI